MKNIITAFIVTTCIVVALTALTGALVGSFEEYITSTCTIKDPHDYLPGWSDNKLEFGQSYSLLILVDVTGTNYYFINTIPGWYSTNGAPIDYTVMCK